MSDWINAAYQLPSPSDAMHTYRCIVFVPRMVNAFSGDDGIKVGWHYGGLINEWRVEGSNNAWDVTHWIPWPDAPKE